MKPDWLKCENCLWYDKGPHDASLALRYCFHSINVDFTQSENFLDKGCFCSSWTCKNCWQTWNDSTWTSDTPENHSQGYWVFADHGRCKSVEFEVKS